MVNRSKDTSSFKDLKVWKMSRDIRQKVSKLSATLPKEEKYRLKDQMIRASRSVTANIAEGYGRFHYQESIQFCRQARGSLYELLDHLSCVLDESYLTHDNIEDLSQQITDCIKLVNGYISYLKKAKQDQISKEPNINYDPNNY